jgi:hypothetical protein
MYSTCIFCHAALGANESIEHFPVGRRLAFDATRGRLWVVCRKCERWNLTPIEERWEAIEQCERLFRSTRLRISTDNVGLARVGDGLELVRIGSPLRPELAAWRYGDQFGRRRRKQFIWGAAGLAAVVGVAALGPITGLIAGGSLGAFQLVHAGHMAYQLKRIRTRVLLPDHESPVNIRYKHLSQIAIVPREPGWALRIPHEVPWGDTVRLADGSSFRASALTPLEQTAFLEGDAALRAAVSIVPALNEAGAKREEVNDAVRILDDYSDPAGLVERWAGIPSDFHKRVRLVSGDPAVLLGRLPKEWRLALEMSLHEDTERRALDGELAILEEAWRRAEEIAAIADNLLVPESVRARVER